MLCLYDLYDLHSIFIGVRTSPHNEINIEIMSRVIGVLKNRFNDDGINQFRIALRPINSLDREGLYRFTLIDNVYCYFPLPFLKDEKIYLLLIKACEHLLKAICEKNEEKIYDLADCLHNLPIIIAENKYSIPKKYWKNEVQYYRSKWEKDFLIEEQKLFKMQFYTK